MRKIKEKTGQAAVVFTGVGVSGSIPSDATVGCSPDDCLRRTVRYPRDTASLPLMAFPMRASFVVGNLREIIEEETEASGAENSSTLDADWLALPVTVNGTIASIDDEDSFTFQVKKDARLICEVVATADRFVAGFLSRAP